MRMQGRRFGSLVFLQYAKCKYHYTTWLGASLAEPFVPRAKGRPLSAGGELSLHVQDPY